MPTIADDLLFGASPKNRADGAGSEQATSREMRPWLATISFCSW